MDDIDRKILILLQQGDMCDPKVSEIAKKLKVSPPTVHRRIKQFEKKGIVREYVAHVDPIKLGKKLSALIRIQLDYPKEKGVTHKNFVKKYVDHFSKLKEVQGIYIPMGPWNLVLAVKTKDMMDHYRLISEKIIPIGRIRRVESVIMMKTFKKRSYVDPE